MRKVLFIAALQNIYEELPLGSPYLPKFKSRSRFQTLLRTLVLGSSRKTSGKNGVIAVPLLHKLETGAGRVGERGTCSGIGIMSLFLEWQVRGPQSPGCPSQREDYIINIDGG